MPYIKREKRPHIQANVDTLADAIKAASDPNDPLSYAGNLNFAVTKLILAVMPKVNYGNIALVRGVLGDVSTEFYRRTGVPYEEQKIAENGDVY